MIDERKLRIYKWMINNKMKSIDEMPEDYKKELIEMEG